MNQQEDVFVNELVGDAVVELVQSLFVKTKITLGIPFYSLDGSVLTTSDNTVIVSSATLRKSASTRSQAYVSQDGSVLMINNKPLVK